VVISCEFLSLPSSFHFILIMLVLLLLIVPYIHDCSSLFLAYPAWSIMTRNAISECDAWREEVIIGASYPYFHVLLH
jgi:hypothetical protein